MKDVIKSHANVFYEQIIIPPTKLPLPYKMRFSFAPIPRDSKAKISRTRVVNGTEATLPGKKTIKHHNYIAGCVHDVSEHPNRHSTVKPVSPNSITSRPGSPPKNRLEFVFKGHHDQGNQNNRKIPSSRPIVSLIEAVGIGGEHVVECTEHLNNELDGQEQTIQDVLNKIQEEHLKIEECIKGTLEAKQRRQAAIFNIKQWTRHLDRAKNEFLILENRNAGLAKKRDHLASVEGDRKKELTQVTQNVTKEWEKAAELKTQCAVSRREYTAAEAKRAGSLEQIRNVERQRGVVNERLKAAEKREVEVTKTVVDALVLVKQPLRETLTTQKKVALPAFRC